MQNFNHNEAPTEVNKPSYSLLSHIRWVSAWLVVFSHARDLFLVDYNGGGIIEKAFYFLSGFGHSSVVTFFVLSGFLVGRKLTQLSSQESPDWKGYMLDRFARIYAVLIPAAALSLLAVAFCTLASKNNDFMHLSSWGNSLNSPLQSDASPWRWIGLLPLLNETITRTPVINGPLWSLAYEWTYYIAGLAVVLLVRRQFSLGPAIIIVWGFSLIALAALLLPAILEGGIVWTFGLLASIAVSKKFFAGLPTFILTCFVAIIATLAWRLIDYSDIILGIAIALPLSHTRIKTMSPVAGLGEKLSDFSYSLYVLHFPICICILTILYVRGYQQRLDFSPAGILVVIGAMALSIFASYFFAKLTERKTGVLKALLLAKHRGRG